MADSRRPPAGAQADANALAERGDEFRDDRELVRVRPIWRTRGGEVRERVCFLLMQFSEAWSDRVWRAVAAAVRDCGLECVRADDDQQGPHVMEDVWKRLCEARLVIADLTGSNPNVTYEVGVTDVLGKDLIIRVALRIGFDDGLAHRIEAGADTFLMPSRYEPCGFSQMYSMRYGTIPVVTATGGLVDTVSPDVGFLIEWLDRVSLMTTMREALDAFRDRERWDTRIRRAMARDFSWDRCASEYVALYEAKLLPGLDTS